MYGRPYLQRDIDHVKDLNVDCILECYTKRGRSGVFDDLSCVHLQTAGSRLDAGEVL